MAEALRHTIRVRYSECDPQGVVFNGHYLAYMDDALTELWRSAVAGGYAGMVSGGIDLVVGEAHMRYLAPARFDEQLEIDVTVTRLGRTGMTTEMRFSREDEAIGVGTLRHVFVVAGTGEKVPIPADVRAGLEPFLVSDGAAT